MKWRLITGGAGFIGSNYIDYLYDTYEKCNIIVVDKMTYASDIKRIYKYMHRDDFKFKQLDICPNSFDSFELVNLFEEYEIDTIINFAAETHVDNSLDSPSKFIDNNIQGTRILLDLAYTYNVDRFIQISTDEVYGDLRDGDPLFTEETPLNPNNPYSVSKASADMLVKSYVRSYGVNAIITRCSNNYGKNQNYEKLIPLMIKNAVKDQMLPVYGDGKNIRDWINVKDHCKGIEMALQSGRVGQVYNFGGGNEVRNIDLVNKILETLGKPKSLISYVQDRAGHDYRYGVDYSKSYKELGWQPEVSFSEGIEETINYYKEYYSESNN